ncbi:hypothetical protein DICPUDRAFT_90764 [Dictyostelium purpureum]|uniref:GrpE protein homolog n=1 Tax=Dictyostelium purpureum TaxID=5786 RepID=F1A4M2_DICPU|nr:uncharacterized protein DICPUDRAFT_90764 [Dictyostelium purpureum]EGC28856.1 hypothetical protein DICPUDRAFT_90764 [Dictyostelium purpureum]|eukprot:XP_003294616.1 hypothetical protein DICPUDRAFT_90764 [Dictyostelium purpureum]
MNTLIRRSLNFNRAFVRASTNSIGNKSSSYSIRHFTTENKEATPEAEKKPEEEKKESSEDIIKKLQEELEETKKQLLYTAADRENVRRFGKEEMEKAKKFGIQSFTKELLEVVDQLEMATSQFPEEKLAANKELKDLHEGVKMTENLFLKIMGKQGLVLIMQSMKLMIHPKEPGTIGNVVKQGYKLPDRLVRPAMVGVIKGKK